MSIGSVGSIQSTANAFELQASRAKDRLRSRGVPDVVVNPADGRAEKLGTPSTIDTPATYRARPNTTYPAPAPEPLGKPSSSTTGDAERLGAPPSATAPVTSRLGAPSSAPAAAPAPDALGAPSAAGDGSARLLGAPTVVPSAPQELGAPGGQAATTAERLAAPVIEIVANATRRLGGPIAFKADVPVPFGRPNGF